jgi:cell division transport system permease protein
MESRLAEEPKAHDADNGRPPNPILPHDSIAGRSLIAVIAIMSFLAALTVGAVQIVHSKTAEWRADVTREVTIQIRPVEGQNFEDDIRKAVEIAKKNSDVVEAHAYSKEESEKLLEPWLGAGIDLGALPVPRLIRVRVQSTPGSGLADLRKALSENVSNASLDDHRSWTGRIAAISNTVAFTGVALLGLVLIATILSVSFATRGAVAANRAVVEVLHFIGARDSYVANAFQRHFLIVGLKGSAIGGALAGLLFSMSQLAGDFVSALPGGIAAPFLGQFGLNRMGYFGIAVVVLFVALITALSSRLTVHRTLRTID